MGLFSRGKTSSNPTSSRPMGTALSALLDRWMADSARVDWMQQHGAPAEQVRSVMATAATHWLADLMAFLGQTSTALGVQQSLRQIDKTAAFAFDTMSGASFAEWTQAMGAYPWESTQ